MATFNDLPVELLIEIFTYLPRKDRITSSMVCNNWKCALDFHSLWKNMTVYLDKDMLEPSTTIATGLYHKHFKEMEFCWASPRLPSRWMQHGFQDFSKRACRYIMMLQDSQVQLHSVRIVDWYEILRYKKIIYHLCKFLRSQLNLSRVTFLNVNFNREESIKILSACLYSVNSLKQMDIIGCNYAEPSMFESISFLSCIERLAHLTVIKIDYSSLCPEILEALIASKNNVLRYLEVTVNDCKNPLRIDEKIWSDLHRQCPMIKVGIHLRNVCHFADIDELLTKAIPLMTFSLSCGKVWDQTRCREYGKMISLLIKYYTKTLENLYLNLNYNLELLDDLLLSLLHKCINLKCFDFYGVIENMTLLREICEMQSESLPNGYKYFHIYPSNMDPNSHTILTKLHQDYAVKLEERDVNFQICSSFNRNLVYVYY